MILVTKLCLLFGLTLCCSSVSPAVVSTYDDQVSFSVEEKVALEKFKAIVIPIIPPGSYLQQFKNDDLYFIRWLRAKNLNVVAAGEMFIAHLAWREDNRMDEIDQENWSKFEKRYPIFADTVDKAGRPVLEHFLGYWNLRKAIEAGHEGDLIRWVGIHLERLQRRLFTARAEGKEIAQVAVLSSAKELDITTQACLSCLPFYMKVASMYVNNYPFLFKDIKFTDAPRSFEIILSVIGSILSPSTPLHVYSKQAEWSKVLDKEFDKSQRSTLFGGTIQRGFE